MSADCTRDVAVGRKGMNVSRLRALVLAGAVMVGLAACQPLPPVISGVDCGPHAMTPAQIHVCWGPSLARYPWAVATAEAIIYQESRGNYLAYNATAFRSGGHATGLMQILDRNDPVFHNQLLDPTFNIDEAWRMYGPRDHRGWQPWCLSCYGGSPGVVG